jgi:regulator of nucleoside diphosphate kinase
MKPRKIFITAFDKMRLDDLVKVARKTNAQDREHLADLEAELKRANVVESNEVPADVVTMNSKVLFRNLDSKEEMTYSLVFPEDANIESGAISILAPVGTALLGYREGSTVEWAVPSGRRRFKIEKILYQPEASGDLHR